MRHCRRPSPLLLALAVALAAVPALAEGAPTCDLLFAGGRVVDGTGAPWFRGDVCVVGDRIASVGWMPEATARRRIDASRLVVAPGFIDMMGQSEYDLLVDSRAASKITQGITTEITGEGSSIAPLNARMLEAGRATYAYYGYTPTFTTLAGYFQELEHRGTAVNLGTFVGAGGVRDLVIGQENRAPTSGELEEMKAAVAQAMEEGALGLSSALIYVPGLFASTDELIALARVAARYGGSYITHQRDEGDDGAIGLDASMDEVFRIARGARARAEFLKQPENADWPAGATRILVTSVLNPDLKKYEGLTLDEIAKERGADPVDALVDVVVADRGNTARVTFGMSEDDVRAALRHPFVSFCTDSEARAEDGILSKQKSHPRAFGSAARILGYYVRDEKVLRVEEAVRKMTSLPASRMRLRDRGLLRAGMAADIVAFDPATVRERATFPDPLHYSEGIPYVAVTASSSSTRAGSPRRGPAASCAARATGALPPAGRCGSAQRQPRRRASARAFTAAWRYMGRTATS